MSVCKSKQNRQQLQTPGSLYVLLNIWEAVSFVWVFAAVVIFFICFNIIKHNVFKLHVIHWILLTVSSVTQQMPQGCWVNQREGCSLFFLIQVWRYLLYSVNSHRQRHIVQLAQVPNWYLWQHENLKTLNQTWLTLTLCQIAGPFAGDCLSTLTNTVCYLDKAGLSLR